MKNNLYKIKKALATGAVALGLITLSACGEENGLDTNDNTITLNEKKDRHLIINIDGLTYIFRECDPNMKIKMEISGMLNFINYSIYDNEDNLILEGYSDAENIEIFHITSEETEKNANMIEEELIEEGAKLYLIPTK